MWFIKEAAVFLNDLRDDLRKILYAKGSIWEEGTATAQILNALLHNPAHFLNRVIVCVEFLQVHATRADEAIAVFHNNAV